MADTKITALTAITTVDPANDVLPIVDVSDTSMAASGTTKKITTNQLLGASGTATLASATITGDLTVRTNKLAVTSTSVGIGTASPTLAAGVGLEIENAGITTLRLQNTSGANAFELQVDSDANGVLYRGYNNSPHVFYVNNSTAMTLNSTGLGVGGSPTAKLSVVATGKGFIFGSTSASGAYAAWQYNSADVGYVGNGTSIVAGAAATDFGLTSSAGGKLWLGSNNGASYAVLDTSGNVGIGAASPNISASGKALTIAGAFTRSRLELQNTDGGTGGVTCGTISWFNGSNLIADITGAANSGSATLGSLAFSTGGSTRLTIDSSGNVISNVTGTAPTLATNSQMVFNLTSNTNLRISVRGTDGTTRTANITLA